MRTRGLALLVAALVGSALAFKLPEEFEGNFPTETPEPTPAEIVPNRYIVEFVPGSNYAKTLERMRTFRGSQVHKVFEVEGIFSGASIEASDDAVVSLFSEDVVARSWPVRKVQLEAGLNRANYSELATAQNYTIHELTGVDKLHEAGILGEGVKIAVVDTGIDYTHHGIGGGFGPGFTVAGGTDYVGDGCWPIEGCDIEPDDDPMDYNGHGTHVAGIIAGQTEFFTGVAPKATLLAWKVFTNAGSVTDDVIVEAFLGAYNEGVDIITASISGIYGWQDHVWALVADRIVDAGVVVTIAAGNNGNTGPFLAASGSSGKNVLAVASVLPPKVARLALHVSFTKDDETETARSAFVTSRGVWPAGDVPIIYIGTGCQPIPEEVDLTGAVALIDIGFCGNFLKERHILAAGGTHAIEFVPKVPFDGFWSDTWVNVGISSVVATTGQAMAEAFTEGYTVTGTLPRELDLVSVPYAVPGSPSYFTTWGGTNDLAVKPDIAAPGSGILSLLPGNAYGNLDGTSMATPYVAGVAALYIGQFGGRSKHGPGIAKKIHARILSSGEFVPWVNWLGDSVGPGASVTQIGNGLINATKVLDSETQLSFTKFALNDTHHFSRYQGVEITNNSPDTVVYTFDVEASGGYEALEFFPRGEGWITKSRAQMTDPLEIVPRVRMPAGTQSLAPGQTKKVEFIFNIPEGMNATNVPTYSGKIIVKGSNGDRLSVPYFGVGADLGREYRQHMWSGWQRNFSSTDRITFDKKPNFTFNLSLAEQDFPRLEVKLNFASREFRWDIFEESWNERQWKYPPVPGKDGFVGSIASWAHGSGAALHLFDPEYDDENDVFSLPSESLVRAVPYHFWWLGRLANGSDIAAGKYNMRIAALQPFGNPKAADNWGRLSFPKIEVINE